MESRICVAECCKRNGPCPFDVFKEEELEALNPLVGTIRRAKGSLLYEEGDSALDCYILCKGEVELFKILERGGNQVLYVCRHGDVLGIQELISKASSYLATARISQDAELTVLPRAEFLHLMNSSIHFCLEVMQRLAVQSLTLQQKLVAFVEKPACQRLAQALLNLAEHHGSHRDDAIDITIPVTNQNLADIVGITPETVSSLLGVLKNKGILRRRGRSFQLLKVEQLQQLS